MGICIKIAKTSEEIDGLLRARHKVFVVEEGYMAARPDGRIFDRFDVYPATANLVAITNNRVVGGVRFVEATAVGVPANDYYDFSTYLPSAGTKIGSGSLLFVERAFRMVERLSFSLMGMGLCWAASRGLTHVVGVVNPEVESFFLKVGFKRLATQIYDEKRKLEFVPVILDMSQMSEKFADFVRNQSSDEYWLAASHPSSQESIGEVIYGHCETHRTSHHQGQ